MAGQILLPGFEPAPEPTDRLFFAVLPDPAMYRPIGLLTERLRAAHGLQGKPVEAGRLHVSLHGLGDHAGMPERLVEQASRAAATVALPAFAVCFDRAMTFAARSRLSGRRPFVLCGEEGVAGLASLHRALTLALRGAGLNGGQANITPHLTLLYDGQLVAEQDTGPVEWLVREFVLLHSRIGQNQPYSILKRWSLPS
jgi:2'-5' RNA ligase